MVQVVPTVGPSRILERNKMFFVTCQVCAEDYFGSPKGAENMGWKKIGLRWYCSEHIAAGQKALEEPYKDQAVDLLRQSMTERPAPEPFRAALDSFQRLDEGKPAPTVSVHVEGEHISASWEPVETKLHPLQEEFGFDKPEDGSERRFVFSQAKQGIKPPWMKQTAAPWLRHRFWWITHNLFIHPLIAVYPCRTTFTLHDWSSRRMHGQKDQR
jgi:hypothetical protein